MKISYSNIADIFKIMQLVVATILNISGLYLLATAKKKKIMILLMIHLTCMELSCTLFWTIEETYHYLFKEWPIADSKPIVIAPMTATCLTLAAITLERVLAVLLSIRFRLIVTKKRLALVLACIWLVSLSTVVVLKFYRKDIYNHILLILDLQLIAIYVGSYTYILITVKRRRQEFISTNGGPSRNRLNLKVPFLLVLTLVCFWFIPDLILVAGIIKERPNWYTSIVYLNYISDPLIYLFGIPECKKRMKSKICFTIR